MKNKTKQNTADGKTMEKPEKPEKPSAERFTLIKNENWKPKKKPVPRIIIKRDLPPAA